MLLRNRDEEDKLTRGAGAAFAKHWGAPVTVLLSQQLSSSQFSEFTHSSLKSSSQPSLLTEKSYRVVLLVVSSMLDSEGHHVSAITRLAYTTSLLACE